MHKYACDILFFENKVSCINLQKVILLLDTWITEQ